MQLTQRDIQIINLINDLGFCDITHLGVFFGLKKTSMYDVMTRLVNAGLVKHKHVLHGRHGVFYVTAKGAKFTDLPPIEKISLGQYEHQLVVIKIYIKLRQHYPCAHWLSERRLKHDKFFDGIGKSGHVSDGILLFPDGKQVAIEVEMSVKGKNRIEKILKGYAAQFSIKEVWYYCTPSVYTMLNPLVARMSFIKVFNLQEFLQCKMIK